MQRTIRTILKSVLPALLLTFGLLAACSAQVDKGRISGLVVDTTGAVIPNVSVVAKNLATNATTTVTTDANGNYTVSAIDPGTYSLTATAPGFETVVKTGVELQVGQLAAVDLRLPAGAVTTQVEVTAKVPLTDTQSASLGQVLSNQQIVDLPLNGRNFYQLAGLTTGAVLLPNTQSTVNSIRPNYISGMTISGVQGSQVGFLIDGIDVTDNLGGTALQISIDAIQEFKVQQNAYSAEFNRAGGIFNITTKSGSNQVHGNLYEFIRNNDLDARNYFALFREPLKRNQFGATLGGPLSVPHLFSGRDKVFLFVSYDGTRQIQGVTANDTVPTRAMLAGDFSAPGLPKIFDPLTTTCTGSGVCTRTQFSSNGVLNVIPQNRLSPQALFFDSYIPTPNSGVSSASFNPINNTSLDQGMVRLDYNINTANRLSVRGNYLNNRLVQGNAYPALGNAALKTTAGNLGVTLTTIINQRMINEFRFGYLPAGLHNLPFLEGNNLLGAAGITGFEGLAPPGTNGSFPDFSWSGYTSMLGTSFDQRPKHQDRKEFEVYDTMTRVVGRHVMKFGANAFFLSALFADGRWNQGQWTFTGTNSQDPSFVNGNGTVSPNGGNAFADWDLGYPTTVLRAPYSNFFGGVGNYYHFFFQDDVKVNSRLSLNLGIRYEDSPWLKGYRGQLGTFDPTQSRPIIVSQLDLSAEPTAAAGYAIYQSLTQTAAQAGLPEGITHKDNKQWAPRLGFAWTPFGLRTVVRGGYGIFYEVENSSARTNLNIVPYLLSDQASNNTAAVPTRTFANFFLGSAIGSNAITPSITPTSVHMLIGYDQHFNLGVQEGLGAKTLFEVDYVGNRGVHLADSQNFNLPAAGPGSIQGRRPYPLFSQSSYATSSESTTYSALQAKMERRASKGWWYLVSYTWSKSMYFLPAPQLGGNNAFEYSRSSFDIPHNFAVSSGYGLPLGKGKLIMSHAGGFTDGVIGGWQLQGIFTAHSGIPFTPTISGDVANVGLTAERPIQLANGKLPKPSVANWFNRAAYTVPASYTYGNAAANTLRAGPLRDLDMSLFKNIALPGSANLEFRYEVFNVTNTASFLPPSGVIDSTAGAIVTGTSNDAREMQFAVKISF